MFGFERMKKKIERKVRRNMCIWMKKKKRENKEKNYQSL